MSQPAQPAQNFATASPDSIDAWRRAAEKSAADPSALTWTTPEGLQLRALYTAAD